MLRGPKEGINVRWALNQFCRVISRCLAVLNTSDAEEEIKDYEVKKHTGSSARAVNSPSPNKLRTCSRTPMMVFS